MKRTFRTPIALLLLAVLLAALSAACGPDDFPSQVPGEPTPSPGPEKSEPLRVLVDFDYAEDHLLSLEMDKVLSSVTVDSTDVKGLGRIIKEKGGFSVNLEFPPSHGNERDTYLTNLRVEIMGGAGPDVFLCAARPSIYLDYSNIVDNTIQSEKVMPVFQFPDKAMQNRVFLPLNERIENARFMEFDKLTPVVMEAGRYEGGAVFDAYRIYGARALLPQRRFHF